MFFENYHLHKDARIRKSLFWEYEFEKINWQQMRDLVVQRVIERGRMNDFYAILNLYGIERLYSGRGNSPGSSDRPPD